MIEAPQDDDNDRNHYHRQQQQHFRHETAAARNASGMKRSGSLGSLPFSQTKAFPISSTATTSPDEKTNDNDKGRVKMTTTMNSDKSMNAGNIARRNSDGDTILCFRPSSEVESVVIDIMSSVTRIFMLFNSCIPNSNMELFGQESLDSSHEEPAIHPDQDEDDDGSRKELADGSDSINADEEVDANGDDDGDQGEDRQDQDHDEHGALQAPPPRLIRTMTEAWQNLQVRRGGKRRAKRSKIYT